MSHAFLALVRADLHTTEQPDGRLQVVDPVHARQHVLGPLESRLWMHLDGRQTVSELAVAVSTPAQRVEAAQVWTALDALADRGLLTQRLAPPAAETVSTHQPLARRQWALAGLALAATPLAFATSAAATEEKAKSDARHKEAEAKRSRPAAAAEQEEKRSARAKEHQQKLGARATEQDQKRSAKKTEAEQKRDRASARPAAEEASK